MRCEVAGGDTAHGETTLAGVPTGQFNSFEFCQVHRSQNIVNAFSFI